jgi:hypothetical protein
MTTPDEIAHDRLLWDTDSVSAGRALKTRAVERGMTDTGRHPEAIVGGDRLEAHLVDPSLRIYDCTTYLR